MAMVTDAGIIKDSLLAASLPVVEVVVNNGTATPTYSRALTSPEQTTANSILATSPDSLFTQQLRSKAKALLNSTTDQMANIVRALILTMIDEINVLRQRDRDRTIDVAAATSLVNLQSRWAARSSLTDRTGQQARTSINNHQDNGDADS